MVVSALDFSRRGRLRLAPILNKGRRRFPKGLVEREHIPKTSLWVGFSILPLPVKLLNIPETTIAPLREPNGLTLYGCCLRRCHKSYGSCLC